MRWLFAVSAMAIGLALAIPASAQDRVTLQLKWLPQAQFAGYYLAQSKGFYRDLGLEVVLLPGGPSVPPSDAIASGAADAVVEWMPAALAAREKGIPLVNIAQMFQRSGMMLTCRRETGVRAPTDLKGRRLGVWFAGNEYPFLAWMNRLNFEVAGASPDVVIMRQGFDVDLLLKKQADCISTMTYNEYWQVIDDGLKADELVVFPYQELGVATLEDGIYTTAAKLADARTADRLARLVAGSLRGWDEAAKAPAQAVKAVLAAGGQDEDHQTRMLQEVLRLIGAGERGAGYLDLVTYDRTVATLLTGGSDPVISRRPEGAWTRDVWEAARKYRK
ncbi:MAG: ABC transporter substrate-binding protein [Alphaproteobacteria bacterium]|nr:ABC transporter substrate-binding protein [Alphaproteobacteria bacterium]